jgi:DNA repair exonuclease SbcCD nuclease subunit
MTYRLLHLADLHLDRPFAQMGCHGELARRRRQGLREALRRAGEAAQEHECDAVTIAGDLFEHERAGTETAQFLVETFAAWEPMRVLLAPGNHDPLVPGSLYLRARWPANVHVFHGSRLEPLELTEGVTVWGMGHHEPAWTGNPLEGGLGMDGSGHPTAAREGTVHLALFHGAETGSRPAGKGVHGPFTAAEIRERGYALALCGHYHSRRIDVGTGLVYPGSPEPLAFDESEPRGPVLVEIGSRGEIRCTGLETNRWHAGIIECRLDGVTSLTATVDRVSAEVLTATAGRPLERTTLRVDLVGAVPPGVGVDLFDCESAVRDTTGVAAVRIRDLTTPAADLELLAQEGTTRGAFVRVARTALAAAESAEATTVINDALRYGLEAFAGSEVGLR